MQNGVIDIERNKENNSFGEFGPKIFENRIDNVDNKISSQSNLFSRSKDFSQSKCFVTKLSILRVHCIDPKNHYNPARAENDLSDPNDYDCQYCLLGPRMICLIPIIMIISIACSDRE